MYSIKNLTTKEPAAIASALIAILNTLVLLGVLALTVKQMAGINVGAVALLGLFVRQSVTPNRDVLLSRKTAEDVLGVSLPSVRAPKISTINLDNLKGDDA